MITEEDIIRDEWAVLLTKYFSSTVDTEYSIEDLVRNVSVELVRDYDEGYKKWGIEFTYLRTIKHNTDVVFKDCGNADHLDLVIVRELIKETISEIDSVPKEEK
ncbi:MAG: hypothetical protein DRG33_07810 [Deltaproteobacteria bacterium]|nr:MAG: hypothetical protein DRG33_07810 [Deltaproteobacteria bacterium]